MFSVWKKISQTGNSLWNSTLGILTFSHEDGRAQDEDGQGTGETHPFLSLEICKEVWEAGIAKQAEGMDIFKSGKLLDYWACLEGFLNALSNGCQEAPYEIN